MLPCTHSVAQVWERVAAPIRNMFITFAFSGEQGCSGKVSKAQLARWHLQ